MRPKVSIVGAGINGLVTALALRLFGIEATLYEKASQLRAEGTGIYIWPQGMQILKALAPAEKILSQGHIISTLATMTATGQVIQAQPTLQTEQNFVAPNCAFHRERLFKLLVNAVGKEHIQLNKHCINVIDTPTGASLHFADGTEIKTDLVIGADGIFSKVRQAILPHVQVKKSGVATCRGIVNYQHPAHDNDRCYIFSSQHARLITYPTYAKEHERYWFSAYRHDDQQALLSKEGILNRFADYAPYLVAMIKATSEQTIIPSYLYDLDPATTWSKGHITLVGDSAHAMLPTIAYGFSMGMENGFLLAQALAANYYSIPEALKRYETRAVTRSNELMEITRKFTQLFYFEDPSKITKATLEPLYNAFFKIAGETPF